MSDPCVLMGCLRSLRNCGVCLLPMSLCEAEPAGYQALLGLRGPSLLLFKETDVYPKAECV